jgi:hypothetical protein
MYVNDNRRTVDHVNKKWVKVLTVITYVISVSLVGGILGLYYKLVWHPNYLISNQNATHVASHISGVNEITVKTKYFNNVTHLEKKNADS